MTIFVSGLPSGAGVLQNQSIARRELKRSRKGAKKGDKRKLDILQRLEENPEITKVELMEELDLSRKQVQKLIKELCKNRLVERQRSNRSGKRIVKNNR